jgi:hypothetical protein
MGFVPDLGFAATLVLFFFFLFSSKVKYWVDFILHFLSGFSTFQCPLSV